MSHHFLLNCFIHVPVQWRPCQISLGTLKKKIKMLQASIDDIAILLLLFFLNILISALATNPLPIGRAGRPLAGPVSKYVVLQVIKFDLFFITEYVFCPPVVLLQCMEKHF